MRGQTVCYHHGGNTAAGKAKGARIVAELEVRRRYADQPVPDVSTDPFGTLAQVVSETTAWYAFLRDRVASVDIGQFDEKTATDVALLERAQDRTERMLRELVRLGLEERLVRISERQADLIGAVIEGVLRRVTDDASVLVRARETVPAVIREVTARPA